MGNAFVYRMPAGIAGALSRGVGQCLIEAGHLNATYPPTVFGIPMKIVSGKWLPIANADTISSTVKGFLVRPYPTQYTSNEALAAGTPNVANIANIMKRGYMMVQVNASLPAAVPAKGGAVYCRKTDHGASEYLMGGIESDADSTKCEAITGCYFTGVMDANGLCEIEYNL
jgi:hypothetical protein